MSLPSSFLDEIRERIPLREFVSKTIKLRRSGKNLKGLCPFHSEKTPSFTVYEKKYHCFGCGAHGDVIDFLQQTRSLEFLDACASLAQSTGISLPDQLAKKYRDGHTPKLPDDYEAAPPQWVDDKIPDEVWEPSIPPDDAPPIGGDYKAVYAYRAADGSLIGYVTRREVTLQDGSVKKIIIPLNWGTLTNGDYPAGRTGWTKRHLARPMPLYGLDLLAARPNNPVIICEGEKAADAARRLFPGYVGISWPRGGQNVPHVDWQPLVGREVVIWPDNDPPDKNGRFPGLVTAAEIAKILHDQGCAVEILDISGLPEKFDAADLVVGDPLAWLLDRLPEKISESPPAYLDDAPPEDDSDHHDPVLAAIFKLNQRYAVVNEAGKALIYQFGRDDILKRKRIDRLSANDFRLLYLNERIHVHTKDDGSKVYKPVANVWLNHTMRRQYIHGVAFDPSTTKPISNILNLWEGYAVQPVAGDWSLLKDHIRVNICSEDPIRMNYLMGWMARMLQYPAEQGEVAVVMRGGEGIGKGTLAKALIHIIGQHGLAISNAKHLVSNFNAHLRDAIFLFADEAFFAGDKSHIGVLKAVITEPYLTVEAKFANAVQMPNFLHVMMASNSEWVVPASLDSRRFFMLEVEETVKNNHEYFGAIRDQMANGGYQAMLYDLLNLDISSFNVRDVPVTKALQDQRVLSLPHHILWWKECLDRGYVYKSKIGLHDEFAEWTVDCSTELLYNSYIDFAKLHGERRLMSKEGLARFMVKLHYSQVRLTHAPVGEEIRDTFNDYGKAIRKACVIVHPRPSGYRFGLLHTARQMFDDATGLDNDWSDVEG